jgi:hypothetical protein
MGINRATKQEQKRRDGLKELLAERATLNGRIYPCRMMMMMKRYTRLKKQSAAGRK